MWNRENSSCFSLTESSESKNFNLEEYVGKDGVSIGVSRKVRERSRLCISKVRCAMRKSNIKSTQ